MSLLSMGLLDQMGPIPPESTQSFGWKGTENTLGLCQGLLQNSKSMEFYIVVNACYGSGMLLRLWNI